MDFKMLGWLVGCCLKLDIVMLIEYGLLAWNFM